MIEVIAVTSDTVIQFEVTAFILFDTLCSRLIQVIRPVFSLFQIPNFTGLSENSGLTADFSVISFSRDLVQCTSTRGATQLITCNFVRMHLR